ncbi:hypothetical protein [Methylomicrobium sp. Wu6]|uniref:hypothetical protein n=1 Tax=Methylomicrobium sp. Wu6 TaxID=3107928 RepID=UPI002DD65E39|nr:hypothetical protein [Methylomicrobium sp. Wu6]
MINNKKTGAVAICAPTFVPVICSERQRRAFAELATNDDQSVNHSDCIKQRLVHGGKVVSHD